MSVPQVAHFDLTGALAPEILNGTALPQSRSSRNCPNRRLSLSDRRSTLIVSPDKSDSCLVRTRFAGPDA
jgi:hypothetical protein